MTGPVRPPRLLRRQRGRVVLAAVVIVVATTVAVLGFLGAQRARPVPDDAERHAVLTATSEAVTALMTFHPGLDASARAAVEDRLTGPLLVRYRSRGPDVVLPGAVLGGATMTARVVGVGLNAYAPDRSQVLVFADQTVDIPQTGSAPNGDRHTASVARWATMRNVEGNWRLADLQPVGDVTR
ncbi:hypothetical protein [Gordonia rhizosphera]|uniref:Mce-associated membrane protein n=1 Tax=Gordonia rhizosphera NBRC 16068 TaxID=1108045 RepID=K6WCS5_9ACTN|nr:hypothetical protein [Gordonia rhizosphera]GAB89997.1 hypothetical protein GORHZ_078_00530 [Gordonia rhizosphera NBRC 16068]